MKAVVFLPVLMVFLLSVDRTADSTEYLVTRTEGVAPQLVPVPHLPTRFLRVGEKLQQGTDFLMIKPSMVVLRNLETGDEFTIAGPNRVIIETEKLKVNEPSRMKVLSSMAPQPAYFTDPKSAVDEIARLMRAKSWTELARYYDLSGTEISIEELNSGRFFVRDKPPAVGHPGGFNRYIQPFAPSFSYFSHQTIGDGMVEVTVDIEIDQGGGMIQRGLESFRMRKSEKGYQLLPKIAR